MEQKATKLSTTDAQVYIEEYFIAYAEALVKVVADSSKTKIEEDTKPYFFEEMDHIKSSSAFKYDETERDKIREFMKENVLPDSAYPIKSR